MDFDVEYSIQNESQFWDELGDVLATAHDSHELIDNVLRTWLSFVTRYRVEYLRTEEDLARCSLKLLECPLFAAQKTYIRRQIVYCLLQEDDATTLHLIAAFLLFDGRRCDEPFEMLKAEGGFPRLVDLVRSGQDDDLGLHRRLLELMYEMSRIQQLSRECLGSVDDAFILLLFQIIEELSYDANDPYHYPVIRVLLVLNEQYMVSAHDGTSTPSASPMTNRVIKVLSTHGSQYKTFGENIILLLNRESETSLQLLILKLLYLLFSAPATREYFYTNDLHVLVDILLRNLLDLPADGSPAATNLRHTYLRVLHPLLAHTQLATPPHYKRGPIRRVLAVLANVGTHGYAHFAPADETTLRLVRRCENIPWLSATRDSHSDAAAATAATAANAADAADAAAANTPAASAPAPPHLEVPSSTGSGTGSGSGSGTSSDALAHKLLGVVGMLPDARQSALSVLEVATHHEKPGVLSPSRGRGGGGGDGDGDGDSGGELAGGLENGGAGMLAATAGATAGMLAVAGRSPFSDHGEEGEEGEERDDDDDG